MIRFLLIATLALPAPLAAQAPDSPSGDQQGREDLARIQARIQSLEKKLAESERNVATAEDQLKRLDLRLDLATEEHRALKARRDDLARRLKSLSADREAAAAAAEKSRGSLVARARVLQRFGRYGYFRILLEARDLGAFLSSIDRLDALARRDGQLLSRDRAARERLTADLAREQQVKKEIDRLYGVSRREAIRVAAIRQEREEFLARQRRFTAAGREEVVTLTDKAARLERLLETLSRQSSDEPSSPSGSIRPWKGVLDWPARGTLIETFGRHRHPRFDAWTFSNGVSLTLPAGTPVRAVYTREGRLRAVAGRVRKPRDPRPRRRGPDALRLAADGARSLPAPTCPPAPPSAPPGRAPAATSRGSISRFGTARRRRTPWRGCVREDEGRGARGRARESRSDPSSPTPQPLTPNP